jgi:hypothetical protein
MNKSDCCNAAKIKLIDELIERCYPYDDYNHTPVISQTRLEKIKQSLITQEDTTNQE